MADLGLEFNQVLKRLEEIESAKQDVYLHRDQVLIDDTTGQIRLDGIGKVGFTTTGFTQFCNRFGMSARYAQKCIERDPRMFANHMKIWVGDYDANKGVLFRTYKGSEESKIRAVLSDRYGMLDNLPVVKEISRVAGDSNTQIVNSGISSDFVDLRIKFPDHQKVIGKLRDGVTDDYIYPAIHIRNSETGLGKVTFSFVVYRLVCSNGMVAERGSAEFWNKKHIGDMTVEYGRVASRLQQTIDNLPEIFAEYAEAMHGAKSIVYTDPSKILETVVERYGLTKAQNELLHRGFAEEPGNTKHHVLQAITASARQTKNWSDRLKLESLAERFLLDRVA